MGEGDAEYAGKAVTSWTAWECCLMPDRVARGIVQGLERLMILTELARKNLIHI